MKDPGSEDHSQQRSRSGVEEGRERTEKEGESQHADEHRQAAFESIAGSVGDHGDWQQVDKEFLEKSAGLPVDQQKDREDRQDHGAGGDF